jgi:uncharacterized membrane protein
MSLLITGLAIFLGVHLLPTVPPARAALVASLGPDRYKAVYALASAAGLVLIVVGYATSGPREPLFEPVPLAVRVAPSSMTIAFILFAAANMRGYLRRLVQHPMLLSLLIWSTVHLFANGDLAGTVLFGAFLAYAVIDLISALARHAVKTFEPSLRFDLIAVVAGVAVALLVMTFHRLLFGVRVVPFGI